MPSEKRSIRVLPDPEVHQLTLYLLWILILSSGPVLYASNTISGDWLSPEHLYRVVLLTQISFLVLIWPLFLSFPRFLETHRSERPEQGGERVPGWIRPVRFGIHTVTLLLLTVPLLVLTKTISGIGWQQVISGQFVVVSLLLGSGCLWWGGGRGRRRWMQFYYPAIVTICFLVPVLFVLLKQTQNQVMYWILSVSPLTAVLPQAPPMFGLPAWGVPCILLIFGGAFGGGILYYLQERKY